jgi:hypothetical protein
MNWARFSRIRRMNETISACEEGRAPDGPSVANSSATPPPSAKSPSARPANDTRDWAAKQEATALPRHDTQKAEEEDPDVSISFLFDVSAPHNRVVAGVAGEIDREQVTGLAKTLAFMTTTRAASSPFVAEELRFNVGSDEFGHHVHLFVPQAAGLGMGHAVAIANLATVHRPSGVALPARRVAHDAHSTDHKPNPPIRRRPAHVVAGS